MGCRYFTALLCGKIFPLCCHEMKRRASNARTIFYFPSPFFVHVVSKIATAFFHHFLSQPGSSVLSRPLREHKECIIFIFNILPLFATERHNHTTWSVCYERQHFVFKNTTRTCFTVSILSVIITFLCKVVPKKV